MLIFYFKDLILKSRIRETAGQQSVTFAKSVTELAELLKNPAYSGVVADLSADAKLAAEFKSVLREDLNSIAVISHVDLDTQKAAIEAGFKTVMPRSRFINELPDLLSVTC